MTGRKKWLPEGDKQQEQQERRTLPPAHLDQAVGLRGENSQDRGGGTIECEIGGGAVLGEECEMKEKYGTKSIENIKIFPRPSRVHEHSKAGSFVCSYAGPGTRNSMRLLVGSKTNTMMAAIDHPAP